MEEGARIRVESEAGKAADTYLALFWLRPHIGRYLAGTSSPARSPAPARREPSLVRPISLTPFGTN